MTISRAALIATTATTVAWTLKAVAIGIAGGAGRSPLEGPLFLLGFGLCLLASALLGLTITRRRGLLGKIVGVLVAAVALTGFGSLDNLIVNGIAPAQHSWVWDEVNLWVLMFVLMGVALVLDRRRTTAPVVAVPH